MQRLTELVHHKRNKNKDNPTHDISRSFLWCWGNLSRKIPAKHKQRTPLLAESLDTERIASITCDARHIIVVTRDGIIYLWELGRSLKKMSKQLRYANYKNRPESLHKLVTMMRNQLPIVSNFEITTNTTSNPKLHNIINADLSSTLNKRIFYGSDAVKWLIDHEAARDAQESIRFCQALLNEGRMECASNLMTSEKNNNNQFKNDRSGLYYFSDSRKKISTNYMQTFHAVPADPTLKFSVVSSNQHYVFAITQNGELYQWDLRQRSTDLRDEFIEKRKANKRNKKQSNDRDDTITITRDTQSDYEYDDGDDSISDPLDSSVSKEQTNEKQKTTSNKISTASMSLNEQRVESFASDRDLNNHEEENDENGYRKNKLIWEQEQYAMKKEQEKEHQLDEKHAVRETVKQVASKWIEPREFFVTSAMRNMNINNGKSEEAADETKDELPDMLLLEKLSCAPQHIECALFERHRMRSVRCGHDFVVILSENGDVFSWGNGYHGKLGLGDENSYDTPQIIDYFRTNHIVINRIECGFDHSLCVTDSGEMYSFGSNRSGKLGIGECDIDYVVIPHRIRILSSKYNAIYHTEYIPSKLCTKNEDIDGDELLLDIFVKQSDLTHDMWLNDVVIVEIACGYGHNLAVVAGSGQIYAWGANLCGQLGLNDQNDRYLPTAIEPLNSTKCKVYEENHHHHQYELSSISVRSASHSSGSYHHHHHHRDPYNDINPFNPPPPPPNHNHHKPTAAITMETSAVIRVGCGAFHSAALSINGHVFCWGDNSEGQLGIGDICNGSGDHDVSEQNCAKLVDYLSGVDTTNICCGADFTLAVSDNFVHYQSDYFDIKNEKELKQRKSHYAKKKRKKRKKRKLMMNLHQSPPKQPQYRQPGLPLKTRSERRKHQKEIEKLQQMFKNAEREKENAARNKFDQVFVVEEENENKEEKKEKQPSVLKKRLHQIDKLMQHRNENKILQMNFDDKGYTEQDMNRAVEFWCKTFIPDFEQQRASPKLRESVWKVGIPTRLRGKVWRLAIGNALNINQTLYELFEKRAHQLIDNKQIAKTNAIEMIGNESTIKYISVDLTRTFPNLSYFQDDGPLNETLQSLLQTYCFFRPDRGYIQGMSYLAANLLLYMDSYNAFVSFANLLNKQFFHCLLSLNDEIIAPRRDIFVALFEHNLPILYKKFTVQHAISPKEYFLDWSISLFTKKLSISVASRVWDIILIFGEMEIYRACVAVLKCIRKELLASDDDGRIRKKLRSLPNQLKEFQLISIMKTIKVPKKLKQKLQKINQSQNINGARF